MQKVIRALFAIADVVLALFLLVGIWILIQLYFAFLDVTIPGGTDAFIRPILDAAVAVYGLPEFTVVSLVLVLLATLSVLAHLIGFWLLLQKQIFGLVIMLAADLVGFLLYGIDAGILLAAAARWLVFGLPWLLTWLDLRRRGQAL